MQSDVNVRMIREVVRHIEMMPLRWDQGAYVLGPAEHGRPVCGTTFCFAGWTARLAGYVDDIGRPTEKGHARWQEEIDKPYHGWTRGGPSFTDKDGVVTSTQFWEEVGQEVLGIDDYEAGQLFSSDYAHTPAELKANITELLGIEFNNTDPHNID